MKLTILSRSLILLITGSAVFGAEPVAEIIGLLQQHYVDRETLDTQKLNEASVAGILKMLGTGARLLTADEAQSNAVGLSSIPQPAEVLARVEVIQPDIGYIRVSDLVNETPVALDSELEKFTQARVTGYVLDLRFADGTNFAAAAAVASRFLPTGMELFTLKCAEGEPQVYRTVPAPAGLAADPGQRRGLGGGVAKSGPGNCDWWADGRLTGRVAGSIAGGWSRASVGHCENYLPERGGLIPGRTDSGHSRQDGCPRGARGGI